MITNPVIESAQRKTSVSMIQAQIDSLDIQYARGTITQGERDTKKEELKSRLDAK